MLPQAHDDLFIANHTADGVDHALPDARQIPEVEDIVKLGWCGEHLDLGKLPEAACYGHKGSDKADYGLVEFSLGAVVAASDDAEYLVDAGVGGQCAVEDGKVTLETLGDVVAAAARLNHRC